MIADLTKEQIQSMNIHEKIFAIMEEVDYIQKNQQKVNNNYTYVGHDSLTRKVRPLFVTMRVMYHPAKIVTGREGNMCTCDMVLRFINVDNREDVFETQCFGYGCDSQDKGPGKAMSYAVKNGLLKTLNLEAGDAEDVEYHNLDRSTETPKAAPPAEMKPFGKNSKKVWD